MPPAPRRERSRAGSDHRRIFSTPRSAACRSGVQPETVHSRRSSTAVSDPLPARPWPRKRTLLPAIAAKGLRRSHSCKGLPDPMPFPTECCASCNIDRPVPVENRNARSLGIAGDRDVPPAQHPKKPGFPAKPLASRSTYILRLALSRGHLHRFHRDATEHMYSQLSRCRTVQCGPSSRSILAFQSALSVTPQSVIPTNTKLHARIDRPTH